MTTSFFPLPSLSLAMRAERVLSAAGIRTGIRRGSADPTVGCGYRLELFHPADLPRARRLLREAGLLRESGGNR